MSFVRTLLRKRQPAVTNPLSKPANAPATGRLQDASYRRFSALVEFGTRFNGVDDVTPVMEQTLRSAVKELEADLGYIMLLNPVEQLLTTEIAVSIGAKRDFPEALYTHEGAEGHVALSGQPIMLTRTDKTAGGPDNPLHFDGEALLCVPLIKQNKDGSDPKSCGTLTLIRERRKKAFRPADEAVARSLASLATIALANAAQYKTLRTSFVRSLQVMAAAVEAKVPYMEGHASRVAQLCQAIGERLQVDPDVLNDLHDGALLHEIGKVGIPDTILLKPGQLTAEEFACLKQYPVIGYEMCKPLGLGDQILTLIRNHPERLDGTGYPDKLKYGELPLPLRILCVADAFDAMSSYRPYRQIMDTKARQEQLNRFAGTQFDPIVVETLKGLVSDGKLEDLYQEHYAKHASGASPVNPVPAPSAVVAAQIYLEPEDGELDEPVRITSSLEPVSPIAVEVSTVQDAAWNAETGSGIYLTGEPAQDTGHEIATSPTLSVHTYSDIDSMDGAGMTLEEAALEAAAFATAAMDAVRDDRSHDKAA